jgi:hypothetical protein
MFKSYYYIIFATQISTGCRDLNRYTINNNDNHDKF